MLMKTPICDFVKKYADSDNLRLHMPGHKGVPFLGVEKRDITEVDGADVLYSGDGIISESERNAAGLFGSAKTLYSAEGSSLCIRAMVYLVTVAAKKQGRKPVILAARNAHKTFISAAAMADADVEWLYSCESDGLLSCRISPEQLETRLGEMSELPVAVYITSPDYLGVISDISAISEVCKKFGVLLLVDNAHGAYLKFLPESKHPLDLGADLCCDSAHKTLPVLTGGAYLHISQNAPERFADMASQAMALFASTSPSYLILQSLDMANQYLAGDYRQSLTNTAKRISALKASLAENGFCLIGDEEMKLCIETKKHGYFGHEVSEYLKKKNIVCEFEDRDHVVMMFTPAISDDDIDYIEEALLSLPERSEIDEKAPAVGRAERVMTARAAIMSPSTETDVHNAVGKVLASPGVSCPPAIPIVVCGERIDENAVKLFKYYGIEKCRVVDD